MVELDSFLSMSLLGETVGQTINFNGFIFLSARTTFICSPPFSVSSEIITASISSISIVTPKPSFSSKMIVSKFGFMELTKALTVFMRDNQGSSMIFDFFFKRSAGPDKPIRISFEAESTE